MSETMNVVHTIVKIAGNLVIIWLLSRLVVAAYYVTGAWIDEAEAKAIRARRDRHIANREWGYLK